MKILYKNFWLQKDDEKPEDYRDAFASNLNNSEIELNSNISFAIADGASIGFECKKWADLIVESYVLFNEINDDFFEYIHNGWNEWIRNKLEEIKKEGKPIPWYITESLRINGPISTLLGLTIKEIEKEIIWSAVSIGDSCLFLVRNDELITKFPIENPSKFDNFPELISLNSIISKNLNFKEQRGDLKEGDRFYLMTDALAKWFLEDFEKGSTKPWNIFDDLDSNEKFELLIKKLRNEGKLKNDDSTLISIDII